MYISKTNKTKREAAKFLLVIKKIYLDDSISSEPPKVAFSHPQSGIS
jgi:hypothetical protein